AYVPLVNAAWNSNNGFGDNTIPLGEFEKFSRLQVLSTHAWAATHAYPGRRIGFAWAPKSSTIAETDELSAVIARSVARARPAGWAGPPRATRPAPGRSAPARGVRRQPARVRALAHAPRRQRHRDERRERDRIANRPRPRDDQEAAVGREHRRRDEHHRQHD